MKRVKSYTSIWNVEKVIYAISDMNLPFPVTFSQMAWFVATLLFVMFFAYVPPLSFIDSVLLKYIGIPAGITWLMSQKTFDGKRPDRFLKSAVAYILRPKVTYLGKPVKLSKVKINEAITAVRSEVYVPIESKKVSD
jgi:hypothetical protein